MISLPPLDLLDPPPPAHVSEPRRGIADTIVRTASQHGVEVKVDNWHTGATVTRYLLVPGPGVAPRKVASLADALSVALGVPVRYTGPLGSALGLEVPNQRRSTVSLRAMIEGGPALTGLGVVVGQGIGGDYVTGSLANLPHLLVAGATGQGKSVFLNGLLLSLLMRNTPADLVLTLIDPKRVELSAYSKLPHLRAIITEIGEAAVALRQAVDEMDSRYRNMEAAGVKNIAEWNDMRDIRWPRRVIVIDELSDLMMQAGKDVEASIVRIAQLGRAAGIHLIVATQYPVAKVVTPLISQNIPSRIAFTTANHVASNVILGQSGAEKLTGKGDALWSPVDALQPVRVQAPMVSDEERDRIIAWWVKQAEPERVKAGVFQRLREQEERARVDRQVAQAAADQGLRAEQTKEARKTLRLVALDEFEVTNDEEVVQTLSLRDQHRVELIENSKRLALNLDERISALEQGMAQIAEALTELMKGRGTP